MRVRRLFTKLAELTANCQAAHAWVCFVEHKLLTPFVLARQFGVMDSMYAGGQGFNKRIRRYFENSFWEMPTAVLIASVLKSKSVFLCFFSTGVFFLESVC